MRPHIFSILFCKFILFLFQSSAPLRSQFVSIFLTFLSTVRNDSHLCAHLLNLSQMFSMFFNLFSPLLASFQLFSTTLTCAHLLSTLLNSSLLVSALLTSVELLRFFRRSAALISSVTCSNCVFLFPGNSSRPFSYVSFLPRFNYP